MPCQPTFWHIANGQIAATTQVRRGIIAAKARLKDPDMQRSLEGDLVDSVELLEHSANLALAALFLVRWDW